LDKIANLRHSPGTAGYPHGWFRGAAEEDEEEGAMGESIVVNAFNIKN